MGAQRGAWRLAVLIVVLTLGLSGNIAAGPVAQSPRAAAAPDDPTPLASAAGPLPMLTARPRGDGWQYTLTLAVPPERALGDLRVELTLPAGSELVEALEARPELEWLGIEAGRARLADERRGEQLCRSVRRHGARRTQSPAEARVAWSGASRRVRRARAWPPS